MSLRRNVLAFMLPFALCGCPAFAALLSGVSAVAPIAVSALDAYTATARAIAGPKASTDDVAAVAVALAERDRCTVAASSALMPTADAGPTDQQLVLQAIRDSIAATQALEQAVARALPAPLPSSVLPFIDAGSPAPTDSGAP